MANLFEPYTINNTLTLRNRFVMSAAADNLDNNTAMRVKRFSQLAEGGVGLIISGGLPVHEIRQWKKVIQAVHRHDGAIALELVASASGPGHFPGQDNLDAVAVSELQEDSCYFNSFIQYRKHHAASEQEIEKIISSFAEAATTAKDIGADAVQIHSAHQSVMMQFLSPVTNTRLDGWGGSLEKRTRIHTEVVKAIKDHAGNDFPVLIKLGVEDAERYDEGLKFAEGLQAAAILADSGYDAVEVSQGLQDFSCWSGTPMREVKKIEQEGYFRKWCREVNKNISKPTIMSGGLRSLELIEEIVARNETDLIGLCRPFIREQNLVNRWKDGDRKKAKCISCNKCITELLLKGQMLECYLNKFSQKR